MAEGGCQRQRLLWLKSMMCDIQGLLFLVRVADTYLYSSVFNKSKQRKIRVPLVPMGENISQSLSLLDLRVKLPHLQCLVIIELQFVQ